ncbi:cytochrome P450 oxidoreductase [Daldinia vernicosa]|uniref:cytochrome P450 oxidoreductase n=1 Tax=Daldinia vernicosa TaxID=114800 RepID=UPI002008AA7F|nr:cytochrome P450 oxidoreductase [Daldinia vernicosa]KAI0844636.1 cytochrome P450 oxidoreductase [Daldinia vernicosa]
MAVANFFAHIAFSYCLFVLCVIVKIDFLIRVIRQQKPSISRVPGPRLARWSRLWIAKALSSGRSHEIWSEVNAKYGPVARIGPNHVVTDDPEITRRILAARSGYVRGPWFDSFRTDPQVPNIVSERDVKKHGQIRAKLAPSFTNTSVAAMEPIIDQLVLGWLNSLRKRFTRPDQVSCDIGEKIQFLTVDVITKICLGEEIGCVKNDRDMHQLLEIVETGNWACQYFSVFLELNTICFQLTRIPYLRKFIFPTPCDRTGIGRLMGIIHEVVDNRAKEGYRTGDVVSSLLMRGMPKDQIDSELTVALVAGSDTTSTSVQSILLSIIASPQVYKTLCAEIRGAVAGGLVSDPIQDSEAKQLVYLQACILEGLRKFPPLSQLRERVVPPGGDTLGCFHLPEGTFVGLNMWGVQLNKAVYGDNAEIYYPERWLIDDVDRLHAMHQTHSLVFGHGSTKCLGMSVAMMEITKVIFELLRNFDITIANPHKPWSSICYGIFFQKNFHVRLSPVNYTHPPTYEYAVKSEVSLI